MLIHDQHLHFKHPLKKAIHIGAYDGGEKGWYLSNGIRETIWIEANQDYEWIIRHKVGPDDLIIIRAVGNENKDVTFHIANSGQSSSVLELGTHAQHYPQIVYEQERTVRMSRMIDLIKEYNINISEYNYLNIDIQGSELDAIKGFEDTISFMDYIYLEVNQEEVYKGCSLVQDIDSYLSKYDFKRVTTHIVAEGWGDALYVKEKKDQD